MKAIIWNFILLIALSLAISSLSGCGGASNTSLNDTGANRSAAPPAANASPAADAASNSSAYPPLASSVAQADIEGIDGSHFTAADRKGNVVLLNLWGVWCGPCKSEMPHLVEMQDKYRDKGLQIIGLNVGDENDEPESIDKIKEFAGTMKLNYELARVPRNVTEDFMMMTKFQGVPQSVVIDRQGRLRGVFLGGGSNVIGKMKETVDKVINEQ